MASSTNKRTRDGVGFARKDFQQPPMLPSDPPGTRRQQQLQTGLGGQIIDKNWDYISGATTLGGGKKKTALYIDVFQIDQMFSFKNICNRAMKFISYGLNQAIPAIALHPDP